MISLDDYDYDLPEEHIAKDPAQPRESARLFVYNTATDEITFDTFANIRAHLPKDTLLVFNNTRVIPARLWLKKETGGKIEVLLMMNEYREGDSYIKGVVDRKIVPGAKLYFQNGAWLEVHHQEEQFFFFKPSFPILEIWSLLDAEGVTPIPPYIKGSSLNEKALREEYQSVLAKVPASVAAPTASLHFSDGLLETLKEEGVQRAEVTLHVGAGTFAPIGPENFASKKLFTEYFSVDGDNAALINAAKSDGVTVIPVGTTALRTIESAAVIDHIDAQGKTHYRIAVEHGKPTDIFVYPPYQFKIADALITNFHVPRSSLMLLVDAMLEAKGARRRIKELYAIAMKEDFKFFSFGDGMLIL
ncbi:MAG TPA: tRNA preQ1(34) S-adenosylmethionine ribosyltransferase-isomerase QueA [Candidatus Paceibacterota bacterium]|nr:tRNA preQ1(34) S-adenosylmethionine ribosyltransferase-isomerase QueA [Candidatus Paceibacterota bacterium]